MKQEKIQEVIKKYYIKFMVKDGQEVLYVGKPPKSAKIVSELKEAKPEIIAELKREQEKANREAKRLAEATERGGHQEWS